MFSFFKKKTQIRIVTYKTKMLKYRNILNRFKEDNSSKHVLLLYFFEQTRDEMAKILEAAQLKHTEITADSLPAEGFNLLNARNLNSQILLKADMTYVLELHPITSINELPFQAFQKRNESMDLTYFTGLDEAVMIAFASGRLQSLLEKMGFKDDEAIEHNMVTKSVQRGQQKMTENLSEHQDIRTSQEAWLEKNNIKSADWTA